MVRIIITKELEKEIDKIFKKESVKVLKFIFSLKENPNQGKSLTKIGGILLKELKYGVFRFYFIQKGHEIKFFRSKELENHLLKFIRISKKDSQQKVIDEIKIFLKTKGFDGI